MPTKTATQNLTIPSSTDYIEDQWLYQQTMASELEARFNSHALDVARYTPRQLAVIDCTITRNYTIADPNRYDRFVTFDSVLVDTGGMADLSNNPWALTPQETGYYHYSAYVKILPSGCTGPGAVQLNLGTYGSGTIAANSSDSYSTEVALTGSTSVNASGELMVSAVGSAFGHALITFLGSSCAATYTPTYARLSLYKVRDL